MKKIFVTTILGLCFGENISFARENWISDSLVNNLSCNSLSVGGILRQIRREAFSSSNHMPLKNWGFRSGASNIAACWGMSSTQRKLFYLLRLNEKIAPRPDTKAVLDIVRGATIKAIPGEYDTSYLIDQNLKHYQVIPVSERNLREEYYKKTGTSFLEILFKGVDYRLDSLPIYRNLKTEIERSQERHFYRLENIGMGSGTGPLAPEKNKNTLRSLITNMRMNRLTLINLRLRIRVQHIVIAKSFTQDDKGNVWIQAYDSNHPEADQQIFYSNATGHFYAPKIMGSYVGDDLGTDYSHPLGVFIVDEPERARIEAALLRHYKKRCL
jgi:hypothetical protein